MMSNPRPTLVYLPWCPLESVSEIGPLRLLPYRRGEVVEQLAEEAGGAEVVERILAMYHGLNGKPVHRAALVQLKGHPIITPLSQEQRSEIGEWVRIVCFTSLAYRDLLSPWDLVNSAHFALRFQEIVTGGDGEMTHLRRDVRTKFGVVCDGRRIDELDIGAPEQVGTRITARLDVRLAKAFTTLAAETPDEWGLWMDAVTSFVEANSDSQGAGGVPTRIDHLLVTSALESLVSLEQQHRVASAKALAGGLDRLLMEAVGADARVLIRDVPRSPNGVPKRATVMYAWAWEFYQIRNDFGHGQRTTEDARGWTLREHEVMGAFVFPVFVRLLLSKRGFYTLTIYDRAALRALEPMLARYHPDSQRAFAGLLWTLRDFRRQENWKSMRIALECTAEQQRGDAGAT